MMPCRVVTLPCVVPGGQQDDDDFMMMLFHVLHVFLVE